MTIAIQTDSFQMTVRSVSVPCPVSSKGNEEVVAVATPRQIDTTKFSAVQCVLISREPWRPVLFTNTVTHIVTIWRHVNSLMSLNLTSRHLQQVHAYTLYRADPICFSIYRTWNMPDNIFYYKKNSVALSPQAKYTD
jgi:hypothetical protein